MTDTGEPLGYNGRDLKASNAILALIRKALSSERRIDHDGITSMGDSIALLGFSKGGIALNQILYEIEYALSNQELKSHELLSGIDSIYYIDVGLPGRGAYLGDPKIWKCLAGI